MIDSHPDDIVLYGREEYFVLGNECSRQDQQDIARLFGEGVDVFGKTSAIISDAQMRKAPRPE